MSASSTIHLHVWGPLACYSRPELKVERVSYPVITPSAARGILEAILYRPQFRWNIRRIAVRNPIQFLSLRRNEVKSKLSTKKTEPLIIEEDRTQRNTLALREVDYIIEAEITLSTLANRERNKPAVYPEDAAPDSLQKYLGMFRRRAANGQHFHQPAFGCREFPAYFELAEAADMNLAHSPNRDADLGLMVYDVFDLDIKDSWKPGRVEKPDPQVTLFRASLQNGILVETGKSRLPTWEELKAKKPSQP